MAHTQAPLEPVEAVLFDLGNVVFRIDFALCLGHWARASGRAVAEIATDLLDDPAYEEHECGRLPTGAYFEHLRGALGLELTDEQMLEGWNAIFLDPIDVVIDAASVVNRSVAVHAFSNTNLAHHAAWAPLYATEMKVFDQLHLSHEMGLRKPDRAAFDAVVDAIGVAADAILFFDDTAENVEGARAAGLQAVRVVSPSDVTDALRQVGLLDPTG